VFGSGTGGFLTAAAITRDSARFKAAISIQGIVDLVTASSYPEMQRWTRYMLGASPMNAPRPYYERSLTNFVPALRTPIIFLYGGRDPNAPVQQIEQFAVQAEVAGKWFDYRIFEAEPHGWQRWTPSSLATTLEATDAMLETYLLGRNRPINLTRNR
jgi:dipeptidyl aminopeptidase/acylaminoacyl peptidase